MQGTISFPEYNAKFNPENNPIYVPLHEKIPIQSKVKGLTFEEIVAIAKEDDQLVIGMLVPKGYIVIDIDDIHQARLVFRILRDRQEKVMMVKTRRGIHIHAYCETFTKKTTANFLACGAQADTITHVKGKTYITMPFKLTSNKSPFLEDRYVVYYNDIGELPFYLTPLNPKGNQSPHFTIPIMQTRNDILHRHLWRMKSSSLTSREREETIRIINQYMTGQPLSQDELESTVLRAGNNDDNVVDGFFGEKNKFLHDKLGDYMIKEYNIRRDARSKLLYHYDDKEQIYTYDNDNLLSAMTRLVPSLKDFQKQETLKYIEQYLYQDSVRFNEDPYNIVFNNGLLNLETLELIPMGPQHHETIKINVDYNPTAHSKTVEEFFHNATVGCPDTQRLLYEAIGYSMLKTTSLEKAFILTGEGRNGKSTYLELVKEVLGERNTTSISMKDLNNNFRVGELFEKLASLAGDISNQAIPDTDLMKSIISGDEVMFEKKYQQAYKGKSYATMFFACNQLPRTPDTSDGFYRRWVIVPFNANLEKISLVEGFHFKRKLYAKESREMVAYMAVQAIHDILINNKPFTEPESVKKMLEEYRTDNSSVLAWAKEKFDGDVERLISQKSDISFGMYKLWAEDNKYKPVRSKRFEDELCKAYRLNLNHKAKRFSLK